nr:PIN domain-containing protein [Conchiformibius kuhniae]
MQHLLIDFETVQPADLNRIAPEGVCVWLLLGEQQQESLPLDLCESLCRFGNNVHFVRVRGGAGAVAVYLAFHLGKILCDAPASSVTVLSANEAYDGLLAQLGAFAPQAAGVRHSTIDAVGSAPAEPSPATAADNDNSEPAPATASDNTAPAASTDSENDSVNPVLEQYYPAIVKAMSQKDAYHPRHRRNLAANIERYSRPIRTRAGRLEKRRLGRTRHHPLGAKRTGQSPGRRTAQLPL